LSEPRLGHVRTYEEAVRCLRTIGQYHNRRRSALRIATPKTLLLRADWAQFAQRGNLMTYGPVFADVYRRLASYVDRIRKGARPGDLPIEQPTNLELVINLKTAKALLLRADEVIQ